MAAHSEDAEKTIEIEKEIIKSTLGKRRFSPLPLFDKVNQDVNFIVEFIRKQVQIESIAKTTSVDKGVVKKNLDKLLSPKRNAYIFELAASVRLETLAAEQISEIEHLHSFFCFLTEFIWHYPSVSDVNKNTVQIVISTASGEMATINKKILVAFTNIHFELANLQKGIEEKITALKKQIREEISEEQRAEMSEEEQEQRLEKEKQTFAQISLEAFHEFLGKSQKYFDMILSAKNQDSYEENALKRQLIAVKAIQDRLAERVAEKEESSKISEKKEDKVLSKDEIIEKIKNVLIENCSMSEQNAYEQALALFDKAEKDSVVPPPPLSSPLFPASMASQKDFRANLAVALQAVVLRSSAVDSKKAGELAANLILGIGGISEEAIQKKQREINEAGVKKAQSSIEKAIPYKGELDIKRYPLAEFETLHVLSALPEGEELDQLDNGYILIGHEKAVRAHLYYLHKDKKDKLVECNPGNLNSLCEHVKKSSEGEVTRLTLDRKQQLDLIINFCGGHNHKLAEDAVLAPVLVAESSSSQSGPSASSSSSAPQKKSLFDEYGIVLLKDGQDWPEKMADKTLYFKWDKSNNILAVKYKKEDGSIFNYEREITRLKNIELVSEAFEQSKETTLRSETKDFLQSFPAKLVPRKSVVLPQEGLKQSLTPKNDVPAVASSGKEEEVETVEGERGRKEEAKVEEEEKGKAEEKGAAVPQAGSSPRAETQLSSSPLSLLASPKSLAKESSANSLAEGSGADSQPNSGMRSPR